MPSTILSDNGVSSGSAGLKSTAGNDGVLILQTTTSGGTATNAIYADNKQNIGIQVTPAAWGSITKALQLGARASLFQYNGITTDLMNNGYFDGTNYVYLETATAGFHRISTGRHQFYSAPSGTAGTAITWTNVLQVEKDYALALQGATAAAAGTGIEFPATQSASTNANTLDDYEEGTWTPTFSPTGASFGAISYTAQAGYYTKIGNVVTVWYRVAVNTVTLGSVSGNLVVTSLPFTVYNNAASYAQGTIDAGAFTTNQPSVHIGIINSTNINIYYRASSNGSVVAQTAGSTANSCYVYGTLTYQTA
jgi:hypothetical protein